jgi:hypothetical protein
LGRGVLKMRKRQARGPGALGMTLPHVMRTSPSPPDYHAAFSLKTVASSLSCIDIESLYRIYVFHSLIPNLLTAKGLFARECPSSTWVIPGQLMCFTASFKTP